VRGRFPQMPMHEPSMFNPVSAPFQPPQGLQSCTDAVNSRLEHDKAVFRDKYFMPPTEPVDANVEHNRTRQVAQAIRSWRPPPPEERRIPKGSDCGSDSESSSGSPTPGDIKAKFTVDVWKRQEVRREFRKTLAQRQATKGVPRFTILSIRKIWSEIDHDGNGSISRSELQLYLRLHPELAESIFLSMSTTREVPEKERAVYKRKTAVDAIMNGVKEQAVRKGPKMQTRHTTALARVGEEEEGDPGSPKTGGKSAGLRGRPTPI